MRAKKQAHFLFLLAFGIACVLRLTSAQSGGPGKNNNGPGNTRGAGIGGLYAASPYSPGLGSGPDSVSEHVRTLGLISSYAREIGKKEGKNTPDLLPLVEQIRTDAKFLQNEWARWAEKYARSAAPISLDLDPYYKSLLTSSDTLQRAQKLPADLRLSAVQIIARDLHNKALNCRNSADGLGKQIHVSARTIKAGADLPGFEIYYVPMALLGQKAEHKRFPNLSSPAAQNNIPPGYYAIWLRKDNATNRFIAQDILSDKYGKCSLEIPVPEEFSVSR